MDLFDFTIWLVTCAGAAYFGRGLLEYLRRAEAILGGIEHASNLTSAVAQEQYKLSLVEAERRRLREDGIDVPYLPVPEHPPQ
jgi:hypothetical protein